MTENLDSNLLKRIVAFRSALPDYAESCLKIRKKDGEMVPFKFNSVQKRVHATLEEQKHKRGFVRAIILKGRQEGVSTYVAGRYYGRASLNKGVNVYILTHEQPATDTLFGMVERFQKYNPLSPHLGASNAKEMEFDRLESSYAVATAGSKAGGRSKAISLFHGSEVAFWPNAPDHFAASVQGVPLANNTEVILESTSNGPSGEFYERYQMAEAGIGDYIAIFVPWYWCEDYQREPEPGFELSDVGDENDLSEKEYAATYGLTDAQMCWRRAKIAELRSPVLFRREYPASAMEAWVAPSDVAPFIDPATVIRARKCVIETEGPLILGVDPAANGGDRFSIAARRGIACEWVRSRTRIELTQGVQWVADVIDRFKPARVNIDTGYIGAALVSALRSMKPEYNAVVRGIDFGARSQAKHARPKVPGPANRRAEMWLRVKEWLESEEGASLPDDDVLQSDLCAPRLKPKLNNDFLLESKQDMKARKVRSPDAGDALALTFASNEYLPYVPKVRPVDPIQSGHADPAPPDYTGLRPGANSWMG